MIDAQLVYGMMNIGTNPTVSDADKISVEVFFFDFDQSIYGQVLIIQLLDRILDEIKFPKIEDLKLQLESDSQKAINRIKLLTK